MVGRESQFVPRDRGNSVHGYGLGSVRLTHLNGGGITSPLLNNCGVGASKAESLSQLRRCMCRGNLKYRSTLRN